MIKFDGTLDFSELANEMSEKIRKFICKQLFNIDDIKVGYRVKIVDDDGEKIDFKIKELSCHFDTWNCGETFGWTIALLGENNEDIDLRFTIKSNELEYYEIITTDDHGVTYSNYNANIEINKR